VQSEKSQKQIAECVPTRRRCLSIRPTPFPLDNSWRCRAPVAAGLHQPGVARRGCRPLLAPQEGVEARCARVLLFVFCAHGVPVPCGVPVSSRASRSGGGAAPAGDAGRAAQPDPAAPGEGQPARCKRAHHTLTPAQNDPRANRAGSPHNARRKRARRAKCVWGTSPAHRLRSPLLALRAAQAKATATANATASPPRFALRRGADPCAPLGAVCPQAPEQ
jgi:hypothetical protein